MSIAVGKTDPILVLFFQDVAFLREVVRSATSALGAALLRALTTPWPHASSRLDDLYSREGVRLMAVW